MTQPWRDAPAVQAFFTRVANRLALVSAIDGASLGFGVALAVAMAGWLGHWPLVSIAVSGANVVAIITSVSLIVTLRRTRRTPTVPRRIERAVPECRNVVVTAAELLAEPARVRPEIGALVCAAAARRVGSLDANDVVPARRALTALGASAAVWVAALFAISARPLAAGFATDDRAATVTNVQVSVVPPAYTKRPAQTLQDPTAISAPAGSAVRVTVRASAAQVAVETVSGRQTLTVASPGIFSGELLADADGFIALEPIASGGQPGVRRLIGLTVAADLPPRVRVTAPGRDLFLPNADRSLDLALDAADDFGLTSLKLRYTKVSGSGEQFTFTDGEVTLDVVRADDRTWRATGSWRLAPLGLAAGDMVVYRAVASDARPGAPAAESDTYLIEIVAAGGVAAGGFSIDEERDRYAISQQMVILKSERLLARRPTMTAEAFGEEALGLAAEQRQVRAEFVFMMGGELAEDITTAADLNMLNEEAHTHVDEDLAAGRLANQGRIDLLRAIRSMSQASGALNTANLTLALTHERAALISLQRAFARTRYILRTLTERERLDLSRRLTGALGEARRDVRPMIEPAADPRVAELRRALSDIAVLTNLPALDAAAAARVSAIAQRVLSADPSAPAHQRAASHLSRAAAASALNARTSLDSATVALTAIVRARLMVAPRRATSPQMNRLDGALTDALRRGRPPQ